MYEESFRHNAELPALTDYSSKETFTYLQLAQEVARLHLVFEQCGIQSGDKIALVGRNTNRWVIAYVATITYGAVIVPILQDFSRDDINNIITHSEARLLFVGTPHSALIEPQRENMLEAIISLNDFKCTFERNGSRVTDACNSVDTLFAERYPAGFTVTDIHYAPFANERLMILSYTSGTTGSSKGVMLSANNIVSNVMFALSYKMHFRGSKVLSYLPLAHAYGCAFDMLTPLAIGSHITLLGKLPSAKVMLDALQQVNPYLVCTVPLVIEKICRKKVFPQLQKNPMKTLIKIPGINNIMYHVLGRKLRHAFGNGLYEVNMGGAAVDPEVETFLKKVKFPFTVGYGMTECAPLISYASHKVYKSTSCGHMVTGMEVKIDSADPYNKAGEILVRGENVMMGYYKNEAATRATIDNFGWLHTGDLGVMDPDTTIYIKGRCKTMILLSNGQNIYPEQIESKLNNLELVMESLVIEDEGKLVALVVPNYEEADKLGLTKTKLNELMSHNIEKLNKMVAPFEKISKTVVRDSEFEKTPKKSIKRYLYAVLGR